MIYLMTFALAVLFYDLAVKYRKNKGIRIFCFLISIGIPTVLAAVRDISVGTDVLVYVQKWFVLAQKADNITEFFDAGSVEPLYAMCTYCSAKLFSDISGLFAVNELLVLIPTYMAIWKCRENVPSTIALAIYYLVFYCHSYNTIRQCIAISFLFLGVVFLFEKDEKKFWLCGFIALGFHYSSVIFLGFYVLFKMLNSPLRRGISKILIIGVGFLMCFYDTIFRFVCNFIPFAPERYLNPIYLYKEWDWPIADTFVVGLALLIGIRYMKSKDPKLLFIGMLTVFSFIGLLVDTSALFASRIFWYFQYFVILVLPQGVKIFKNNSLNRLMYNTFLVFLACGYWYIHFIYTGPRVWPYVFARR